MVDLELRHGANGFEAELLPSEHIRVRTVSAFAYAMPSATFEHYTPNGHKAFLMALEVCRRDFRVVSISEAMRALLKRYGYEIDQAPAQAALRAEAVIAVDWPTR